MRVAKAVASRTGKRIVQKLAQAILADLTAPGNPVGSLSIIMPRYLWHFDAGCWPLERIDTLTGEHVPVFTGGAEESLYP